MNLQGILRFVSPSAKRSLGYEIEELLNRNTYEFTHPDDAPKISEAVEKLIKNPGFDRDRRIPLPASRWFLAGAAIGGARATCSAGR